MLHTLYGQAMKHNTQFFVEYLHWTFSWTMKVYNCNVFLLLHFFVCCVLVPCKAQYVWLNRKKGFEMRYTVLFSLPLYLYFVMWLQPDAVALLRKLNLMFTAAIGTIITMFSVKLSAGYII